MEGGNIQVGEKTRIEDYAYIRSAVHDPEHEYVKIGNGCRIWHGVEIHSWGGCVEIGNHCSINPYSVLYGTGKIKIGNNVRIAAHTVIVSSMHRYERVDIPIMQQGIEARGITIEDDVWIGAGVRILDGIVIGKGAIVGAGAVVTKNVPSFSIVAGVPARHIKNRNAQC